MVNIRVTISVNWVYTPSIMKNKQRFILLTILTIVFFFFSVSYYLYNTYGPGRESPRNIVIRSTQLNSTVTVSPKDKKPFDCSVYYEKQIIEMLDPKIKDNVLIYQTLKDRCTVSLKTYFNDFTNDGCDEVILITSGAGCASCHAQQLLIFKDDQLIFEKGGSDLIFTLNPDKQDEFTLQSYKSIPPADSTKYTYKYNKTNGNFDLQSDVKLKYIK